MASQVPPKRGVAFSFETSLVSQADTDVFQTSVTLAAGDVVVYQDGVLDGNIDTLPSEIGTTGVLVVALSADEMTADRVTVRFHDAAGSEWQDQLITIQTVTTSQIDDLATAAALAVVDSNVDAILEDTGTTLDGKIDVIDGNVDAILADTGTDGVALADGAITAAKVAANAIDADALAADAVDEIAADVWSASSRTLTQSTSSVVLPPSTEFLAVKDPDDVLSYSIDWETWLDGDTISASAWSAETGITVASESETTTTATVWLSGGTSGRKYRVTNQITTAGGKTAERSVVVMVQER